ncbi:MAE_28990/MAE_18760 family HEPN-like nuclease [Fusobacterium polymorphum]|uniref:MAE_28990/MAE_18760 family HEPN-like nuclease n=1 Tax=Fusobacterium nucleatum subsp. polymorphum TaxID=76857 RepID=UPI0030D4CEFA
MSKNNLKEIFLENIEVSFSNRKKELFDFLEFIKSNGKSLDEILNKSYVLLLYAHWEGFIKENLDAYLQFISSQNKKINMLTKNFLYMHLKNILKNYNINASLEQEKDLINYISSNLKFKIPIFEKKLNKTKYYEDYIIGIKSNLQFEKYVYICEKINYQFKDETKKFEVILRKLLHNRNSIAHTGIKAKDDSYTDIEDLKQMYEAIIDEMEKFKNHLTDFVSGKKYLLSMHI